jgi:hypothetical protein
MGFLPNTQAKVNGTKVPSASKRKVGVQLQVDFGFSDHPCDLGLVLGRTRTCNWVSKMPATAGTTDGVHTSHASLLLCRYHMSPPMQPSQPNSEIDVPETPEKTTNGQGAPDVMYDGTSESDVEDEPCGQPPQPATQILARLSKLSVNWKKILEAPEHHDGKPIYFAVQMTATRSTGVTVSSVLRLPCQVELDVKEGRRLVEALFVIRNKRGCVFAVFDAVNHTHFFVKPIEITSILEFLPNRVAMAREQIGNSIKCMNTAKPKKSPKGIKRARTGEDWQAALLAFCACILDENASIERRESFEKLKASLGEDVQPTKGAKCKAIANP